ncbi:hypothetical protein AAGG49_22055, partial [Stenotrophomonas maltophilia]|uniref:hypothetical protein n=1 Tax=Stenotrophomonas maltophilia TaxID=40324 RepID=UPI00313A775B
CFCGWGVVGVFWFVWCTWAFAVEVCGSGVGGVVLCVCGGFLGVGYFFGIFFGTLWLRLSVIVLNCFLWLRFYWF